MFLKTPEQFKALDCMEANFGPFNCRLYVYNKLLYMTFCVSLSMGSLPLPDWLATQHGWEIHFLFAAYQFLM